MKKFRAYEIRFASLPEGSHTFDYQIGADFFAAFEHSLVQEGKLGVEVVLQKYPTFINLVFNVSGTVNVPCDICAEEFDLEVENNEEFILKFVEEIPETSELDIIYLKIGANSINVAEMIYELVTLSMPIRKVHPLDAEGNPTCDPAVLQYLSHAENFPMPDEEDEDDEPTHSPFRDAFKNLKNIKNKE